MLRCAAVFSLVAFLGFVQASAASANNGRDGKDKPDSVESILGSVVPAELPAKAAELIAAAKPKDREDVALAAVVYIGKSRPASIVPVVSSTAAAVPEGAAAIAASAVKLVPGEAEAIKEAALNAAPRFAEQITRALAGADKDAGTPVVKDPGNRPTVPPGQTTKGSIRGNRPETPPGLTGDPKPGRDPQRRRYGSP